MPSPWLRRELRSMAPRTCYRRGLGITERTLCGEGLRWSATNHAADVTRPKCLESMETIEKGSR
jgi:hypothetical protein